MANLGNMFKENVTAKKTEEKHPRRSCTWLHYTKLIRSAYQKYSEEKEVVRDMADMIRTDGEVLQDLRVRKIDANEYEIISGHKRTLACKYLTEEVGLKGFEFLPCNIVDVSDVRARFQVMSSNWHHEKTPYEIMLEIEDMTYLLKNYPEEFPDLEGRGRIVEKLAKRLKMSRSVVTDYQSMAKNLSEKGKQALKEEKIDKSAAVALSGLPEPEQKELLDQGITRNSEIRQYKQSRMREPTEQDILWFYNLTKEYDTDRKHYKEYLITRYGKAHSYYGGENTYQCSIRGIKLNGADEITWSRYLQLLNVLVPTVQVSKAPMFVPENTPLVGQLQILNTEMELGETGLQSSTEYEWDLSNYQTWPVWCENKLTGETFYRKELPDSTSIIVRHYLYSCPMRENHMWSQKEKVGSQWYHIKPDTKYFKDGETSMTALKEHLKKIRNNLEEEFI